MQRIKGTHHNTPTPVGSGLRGPTAGVHVRQHQLLRTVLIVMLGLLGLNLALAALLAGPAIFDLRLLAPSLTAGVGGGVALWLLARRRFYPAGVLATAAFFTGDAWEFIRAGLAGHEISLLMFLVPTILAGLLLERVALYLTVGASLALVLGVHALELTRGVGDLGTSGAVLLFSLILILLAAFFDRFGIALRDALQSQAVISAENERLYEQAREFNLTLEARVAQRTAELEDLNAELKSFSYSVSHDLRAPLRAIEGFSQVLLEDHGQALDEDGRRHLRRIAASAERMGQLIDDLLGFSHLGRAELGREPVDLSELARTVAAGLRAHEPAREVTIEVRDGLAACGDERLLRIALENLLGNALKFSRHREHARIEVGWSEQDGAFFVRDDGAGFDMAFADKLFVPFQRLHAPGEYEGTGIGLATTQRVITRHGGRIWARGKSGEGATFYFTLPRPGSENGQPNRGPRVTVEGTPG